MVWKEVWLSINVGQQYWRNFCLDFTLFISPPNDLNFIGMRDDYPTKVCHEIFLGQKTPRIINMIDSPEFSKNGKNNTNLGRQTRPEPSWPTFRKLIGLMDERNVLIVLMKYGKERCPYCIVLTVQYIRCSLKVHFGRFFTRKV